MSITDLSPLIAAIDDRIERARDEIAQLERARQALIESQQNLASAGRESTRRPARRDSRRPRTRRAARAVVPVGKITTLLQGSEGMGTAQIAAATGGHSSQILSLLKEQEQAGNVRRSGGGRSTHWHLVTDEDRIALRAAELERQMAEPR